MKSEVIGINPRKGFVAVRTDGGITVFELLEGYDVEGVEGCGVHIIAPRSD